jgi:hypothetical protein
MAKRGSVKALSVEHENFIAYLFGGRRSRSSGAAPGDPGDVRADPWLAECKMTGNPSEIGKRPGVASQFEKIAKEAAQKGLDPMLALRWYDPDSPLANRDGWCDLVVMKATDAAHNGSQAQ